MPDRVARLDRERAAQHRVSHPLPSVGPSSPR
jgi:hypothetical protein